MPGKRDPNQAEALTMIAVQVMAKMVRQWVRRRGRILEMNVYSLSSSST